MQQYARGEKVRGNGKRRHTMGDKGKKAKDKGQRQKEVKQAKSAKQKKDRQQPRPGNG